MAATDFKKVFTRMLSSANVTTAKAEAEMTFLTPVGFETFGNDLNIQTYKSSSYSKVMPQFKCKCFNYTISTLSLDFIH